MNPIIPKTRLEFLMLRTNVTGKTLAKYLHVDMSLVSRWKNGTRNLQNNNTQLEKICGFFITSNEGEYFPIVQQFMKGRYTLERFLSEGKIRNLCTKELSQWLLQPMRLDEYLLFEKQAASGSNLSQEKFYITFEGNKGRRQAILAFLEMVQDSEHTHRIFIMDGEKDDWLLEDQQFFEFWKEKMLELLSQGHQLVIIRRFDQHLESLFNEIVLWMPIYLNTQVQIYMATQEVPYGHQQSFYLLEEAYSLNGFYTDDQADGRFSALTNDLLTVRSYQNLVEKILGKCYQLFYVYTRSTIEKVAETILKAGANNDNSYFMSNELFFSNMSEDLVKDILRYNACEAFEEKRVLNFYHQLNHNFGQNIQAFKNQHTYSYQCLEAFAKQNTYLNSHLSFFAGRPIYMNRQHYIRHIEGTMERLKKNADFSIALTRLDQKVYIQDDLDLWIKDGHFLCVWSNKTYEYMLISLDPSVTHIFTERYEAFWKSIPTVERDKTVVLQKFDKLLSLARSLESRSANEA